MGGMAFESRYGPVGPAGAGFVSLSCQFENFFQGKYVTRTGAGAPVYLALPQIAATAAGASGGKGKGGRGDKKNVSQEDIGDFLDPSGIAISECPPVCLGTSRVRRNETVV